MISFFKSEKKSILEFLKNGYIDIHSHILPGIDDGAKNAEGSIELIKKMYSFGIKNFIFTPHIMQGVWENTPESIEKSLSILKIALDDNGINDVRISAAAEYMLDQNFNSLLAKEKLLTLIDPYILVEMSYLSPPINLYETLFDVQIKGYKPVLAHPERYNSYHKNYKEYSKLKEAGCLFQLNLLALSNYYGKDVQKIAIRLLKDDMYDFAGSDAHHLRHLNYLEKITDKKTLKLIQPLLEKNSLFFS